MDLTRSTLWTWPKAGIFTYEPDLKQIFPPMDLTQAGITTYMDLTQSRYFHLYGPDPKQVFPPVWTWPQAGISNYGPDPKQVFPPYGPDPYRSAFMGLTPFLACCTIYIYTPDPSLQIVYCLQIWPTAGLHCIIYTLAPPAGYTAYGPDPLPVIQLMGLTPCRLYYFIHMHDPSVFHLYGPDPQQAIYH